MYLSEQEWISNGKEDVRAQELNPFTTVGGQDVLANLISV